MKRPFEWPSREQWAKQHQHPYWDYETGCPFANKFGHHLSDHAASEEVTALRSEINDLLTRIRDDAIPNGTRGGSLMFERTRELVAPFVARYDAAFEAARESWWQECAQIPVDDAAWESELRRRASIDREYEERQ
jgi:hypothetical protein